MKIRTIVIDNQPNWLDLLKRFVQASSVLELVGTFSSTLEAYPHIAAGEVDLVVSDIDLPELDSVKFIKSLENPPLVVFVTAHSQYALEGFEISATDFLVKPVELERFMKCVEKVRLRFEANKALAAGYEKEEEEYFFIKIPHTHVKLRYNEVVYLKSMENYVQVHTIKGDVHTVVAPLRNFEQQLPPSVFSRIHRSYLINNRFVNTIERESLTLVGNIKMPISAQYRDKIQREIVDKKIIRRD